MTITLVGSDLDWLREIYNRTILGQLQVPLPEDRKNKFLNLDLIDDNGGRLHVTQKGHEELKRHRAE
jgi:hypothetical protein